MCVNDKLVCELDNGLDGEWMESGSGEWRDSGSHRNTKFIVPYSKCVI